MSKRFQSKENYLVGIISDTHGRLSQSVAKAFAGVDLIIHAGDIGEPGVLKALQKIAPTIAVRGNMDFGRWAQRLSSEEHIECNQTRLAVLHDVFRFRLKPGDAVPDVVISGHTHQPLKEDNQGVLYINPGSAGYPRYGQPAMVALLQMSGPTVNVRFVELKD
jgi:putative phosphoesterase